MRLEPAEWNTVRTALMFHGRPWTDLLARHFAFEPLTYAVMDGDARLGTLHVARFRRWGVRIVKRPWATPYFGLELDGERGAGAPEVCAAIARVLSGYPYVSIANPPGAFEAGGEPAPPPWSSDRRPTLRTPLADVEALWARIDPTVRRQIRKAERAGLDFGVMDDPGPFFALYRQVYERQGIACNLPPGLLADAVATCRAHGIGELYGAGVNGTCHAATLITWDAGTAYYTLSASGDAARQSGAPSFLLWKAMNVARARRLAWFDFVGTGAGNVTAFKKKFGGRLCDGVVLRRVTRAGRLYLRWRG